MKLAGFCLGLQSLLPLLHSQLSVSSPVHTKICPLKMSHSAQIAEPCFKHCLKAQCGFSNI